MKKVITIQLGGIKYQIEDDAYSQLFQYLESIKAHYQHSTDGNEIANDIEFRISEMILSKISKDGTINLAIVNEIISIMGLPNDFDKSKSDSTSNFNFDKQYANNTQNASVKRKLYRDAENRVIGGVCSGIATYLSVEPWIIRFLWLASMFIGGFGFVLYIIFWIVLSKAITPSQKLEMRGEPVNFQNLYQDFENTFKQKDTNFLSKFINLIGELVKKTAKFIIKLFSRFLGVVLMVIAFVIGIVLFFVFSFSTFGNGNFEMNGFNFNLNDLVLQFHGNIIDYKIIFFSTLISLIIIELGFVVSALKFFGSKIKISKPVFFSMLGILFLCFILGTTSGLKIASNFSYENKITQSIPLQLANGKLTIAAKYFGYNNSNNINFPYGMNEDKNGVTFTDSGIIVRNVTMILKPSKDSTLIMGYIAKSNGKNKKDAFENAKSVAYNFDYNEGNLIVDDGFFLKKNDKWRNQDIELVIYIPQNLEVNLDETLNLIDFKIEDEEFDFYSTDAIQHTIKNVDGKIKCLNCDEWKRN